MYLSIFYSRTVWLVVVVGLFVWLGQRAVRLEYAKYRVAKTAKEASISNKTTMAAAAEQAAHDRRESNRYVLAKRGLAINEPILAAMRGDPYSTRTSDQRKAFSHLLYLVEEQRALVARVDAQRAQENGTQVATTV